MPAQTYSVAGLGFSTCLAGQDRWTLVLCGDVAFPMLLLILSLWHLCLGQQHWLCVPQYVTACSEPQPTPRPQELLLSLPAWRCSPSSSDKASQWSLVPSVSIWSKECLVWSTSAAKLMLKKAMRGYEVFQLRKYWENTVQRAARGQVPSCYVSIAGALLLHFAGSISFLRHHMCQEST